MDTNAYLYDDICMSKYTYALVFIFLTLYNYLRAYS